MSTIPSSARGSLRDLSQASEAATRLGQQLTTGKKVRTPKDDPATWLQAGRAQSTAGYLDAIHTGLNELATNIRVANTTMQAIGSHLSTMKSQLEQALKYPAGDSTRQQLITNADGMRQQIDDLVNTAVPSGARHLLSDPVIDPQAGDVQALVGINGERKIVHRQQVDTRPGGLNISKLLVAAGDAQIQVALQALDSAQTRLAARQNGLSADAADVSRYIDQSASVSGLYQSQAEALTAGNPTEAALELQSVNVRQSLAVQSLASVSTNRNAILELLQ
jgi:hypothetical protein